MKNKDIFAILFTFFLFIHLQAQSVQWTQEELANANTAANIEYLTDVEKEVFKWVNLARLYPQKFAPQVEVFQKSDDGWFIQNSTYVNSLIRTLKKQKPLPALQAEKELYDFALCHAENSGKKGYVGHDRKKSNCDKGYFAECCSYGMSTAYSIVMQLLIDDGVKSLGHRKICLSPDYGSMGVSVKPHKKYEVNAVLDLR